MSESKRDNTVTVSIFGLEYPIAGGDDPARIHQIARQVDERMEMISRAARTRARDKVAILTALSFASELLEQQEALGQVSSGVDNRIGDLLTRLDAALAETANGTSGN